MENEFDHNSDDEVNSPVSNDSGSILVGEGVLLEGRIVNAKDTNISGTYNGSVSSDSLYISKNGNLTGDIKTHDMTINGKFTGDIRTENSLVVNSTALAKGNFEYSTLEVKFGATIEGMVKHSGSLSSFTPSEKISSQEEPHDLDAQSLDSSSEDNN